MTPRLCTPSTFRMLRVAVLPPVLTTTAVLGMGISSAYGIAPGQGTGPPYGLRPASYAMRSAYGTRLSETAAAPAYDTRSAYTGHFSAAPPMTRSNTAGHPASAASVPISAPRPEAAPGAAGPPAAGPPAIGHPAVSLSLYFPVKPSPDPSLAGSRAGEGRLRPGRPDPESHDEADEPTYTNQDPSAPADRTAAPEESVAGIPDTRDETSAGVTDPLESSPSQDPAALARQAAASEPVMEILPLGSGLVLVGAGLALALLALRLRRE